MCTFEEFEDWDSETSGGEECPYEGRDPGRCSYTGGTKSGTTSGQYGCCNCDNRTDSGNTKPSTSGSTGRNKGYCNCDNRTDSGNTKPGTSGSTGGNNGNHEPPTNSGNTNGNMFIELCDKNGTRFSELDYEYWVMEVDEQYQFKYYIGNRIGNPKVEWRTSDSEILQVNANGLVTAIATGSAVITVKFVTNEKVKSELNITVVRSDSGTGESLLLTNEEVQTALGELKKGYASGKYWNHDPSKENNPYSVTDTPCTHNHEGGAECDSRTGSCGCNHFGGGIQCYGFAMFMAFLTFGNYPDHSNADDRNDASDYGNGWRKYNKEAINQIELEPGDIVRSGRHSAIVYSVDKENNSLEVGECWGNPPDPKKNCRISWGNFNGSRSSTLTSVLNNTEYIFKAPKKRN